MLKKRLMAMIGPCYFAEGAEGNPADGMEGGALNTALGGNMGGGSSDGGTNDSGLSNFNFEEFKTTYGKNYADKGFMQELTSPEKMFEKIDNMESLIGKKSFVPGENATTKDWDDYRSKIGVASPDVYTISKDGLPEEYKKLHNDDMDSKVKQMFYDAGLTPQQAKILNDGYDKLMVETHKDIMDKVTEQQKAMQISDAEYDELANKIWGADREKVQNVAKSLIMEFTPQELKPALETMGNKNLVIMASVLKGVSDKYISSDDLSVLQGNTAGTSKESLREEAQKELAKLHSMSPFDPNYAIQKQKVEDMYKNFK